MLNKESAEPRRVLFVHDGPLRTNDNINFYGVAHGNSLKERFFLLGNQVTFLMRKTYFKEEKSNRFSKIENNGFSFIEFPNVKSVKGLIFHFRNAQKIVEEAVKIHDIIIARLPSSAGNLAVKYARKHKKPFMVEFVACGWDALWNYNLTGKILAPYFFVKQRLRIKKVPYIVYVTKSFLQKRYPSNATQVNISNVEISNCDQNALKKRIEKIEASNENRSLVLGTVASLNVPYKGQADVIKAIFGLKKRGVTFKYELVGEGSPERLRKLVSKLNLDNQVRFIGPKKHQEVFDFLDQIDVYIQPSKQEGLPRAVIEAMSRACPVVGAKTGGIPELINPERIFSKGRVKQIETALLKLLDKNVLLNEARQNFETSKEYRKDKLHLKRVGFYNMFLSDNGFEPENKHSLLELKKS